MFFRNLNYIFLIGFLLICLQQFDCGKSKKNEALRADWGKIQINPTKELNQKNREIWDEKAPKHFRYKARVTCDCGFVTYNENMGGISKIANLGVSWMCIEESNGEIKSVKNIDGSENNTYLPKLKIYSSAGLITKGFDSVDLDADLNFNERIVIYDSLYGFPRYYEILRSEKGPTDVAFKIEIIEFEILPEIQKTK